MFVNLNYKNLHGKITQNQFNIHSCVEEKGNPKSCCNTYGIVRAVKALQTDMDFICCKVIGASVCMEL